MTVCFASYAFSSNPSSDQTARIANPFDIVVNADDLVVEGDLFIVPNGLYFFDDYHSFAKDRKVEEFAKLGISVHSEDPLVEVWAVSRRAEDQNTDGATISAREGVHHTRSASSVKRTTEYVTASGSSDNWSAHGHPDLKENFPSELPLSLFKGLKQGDFLLLKIGNSKVKLRLMQDGYRYGSHRFGLSFEKMLAKLVREFKARYPHFSFDEKEFFNTELKKSESPVEVSEESEL